jgi:hypothetical protein
MKRLAVLLIALAGCGDAGDSAAPDRAPETPAGETIERVSENGPIKATVSVTPASPQLGDPVELTLTVEARPGVTVEMPSFGEALGRFSIVRFTPRLDRTADGGTVASQRYVLDPPMSGVQRIPPLRIEYLDERPGQTGGDAGVAGVRELLTEEVAVDVQSVVTDSELTAELAPARGRLEPQLRPADWSRWLLWLGVAGIVIALAVLFWALRFRRRRAPPVDPYRVASARLSALEARGLPVADQADAWFVELSGIIRQYIENRYGIRAPELTTEEFLRVAGGSTALTADHRELLSSFLETCDRVKFAGHVPDDDESQRALAAARSFLDQTRPAADDDAAGPRAEAA